jgi:hypothetical protein
MELYLLIKPIGIITYTLLSLTVLIGLFKKRIKFKAKFLIHKWLGISALVMATFHFALIIIYA